MRAISQAVLLSTLVLCSTWLFTTGNTTPANGMAIAAALIFALYSLER